MQFGLTETQQVLKSSAREFFSTECPWGEVRRLMNTGTAYDATLWQKMAQQGWTGIIFPEEYGGLGLGMVDMAVALEEMGRALLPGPYFSTVLLAGAAIESAGNAAQKKRYLSRISMGEARATVALLENKPRWEPEAVQVRARLTLNGWELDGRKLFVTDAGSADFLVCVARRDGDLGLYIVPRGARGLTIELIPRSTTRANCTGSISNPSKSRNRTSWQSEIRRRKRFAAPWQSPPPDSPRRWSGACSASWKSR